MRDRKIKMGGGDRTRDREKERDPLQTCFTTSQDFPPAGGSQGLEPGFLHTVMYVLKQVQHRLNLDF